MGAKVKRLKARLALETNRRKSTDRALQRAIDVATRAKADLQHVDATLGRILRIDRSLEEPHLIEFTWTLDGRVAERMYGDMLEEMLLHQNKRAVQRLRELVAPRSISGARC